MTKPPTHPRQLTALTLCIAAWLALGPGGAVAGEPIQSAGSMAVARRGHTATVLADGRVLIVGGLDATGPLAVAEIFDPAQKTFSVAGNLVNARYGHTATLLQNGRVLITGGQDASGPLTSAEIFDPADTNGFRLLAATMGAARVGHTATVRSDGTVLLAGGDAAGTAEVFDPATESFYTPLLPMAAPRAGHTATSLADDNVFLVGGGTTSIELFNAASNSFSLWPLGLSQIRSGHSSIPTSDGRLLVIGGDQGGTFELFDATAGSSLLNLSLGTPSTTANLLANNKILVLGNGVSGLFDETTDQLSPLVDTNASLIQLSGHTATELPTANRQILVAGGIDNSNNLLSSATLYNPAQISTDAGDYPPFSWVNIYGQGFLPNETVTNQVEEIVGPAAGTNYAPWSVTADTNGAFTTLWQVFSDELLNTTLKLTAVGQTSGLQAETVFTDSSGIKSISVGTQTGTLTYGTAGSVTYTITVAENGNGNPSSATLGITGLPTGATGTFNPPSVPVNGSQQTSTLTITTTSATPAGGPTFTVNNTFDGTTANGTLTVSPKALTMSGLSVPSSKVYDATTIATVTGSPTLQAVEPKGTGTSSDGKPYTGDAVSIAGTSTGTYNSKDVATATTVTFGGLSLTGAQASDYTLTIQNPAAATITAKPLTETGLSAPSKTYNATTAATLSGTAGLQAAETPGAGTTGDGKPYTGDTVTITGTPAGTYNSKDVLAATTVTVSGLSLTGSQAGDYTLTTPTIASTITPKALTETGLSVPASKVYDATTTAGVSGTAALLTAEGAGTGSTVDGKPYTGDGVIISGAATGTYNSKDVATANTVTFNGLSLTGAQAADYSLTTSTAGATITPKALTESGLSAPASKVYDATTSASVSGTAVLQAAEGPGTGTTGDGKPYSSDTVSITGTATGTYNSKDVATATTVTFGGLSLTGAQAGDYSLTIQSSVSATVTPKALTESGLSASATKVYDATTTASVSGTATLLAAEAVGSGTTTDGKRYTGDTVSISGTATGTYNSKDVATATTVTFGGLSLTGAQAGDYTLSIQSSISATITAKALTQSGLSVPSSKVYDATTAAAVTGTPVLGTAETPGSGTTADGKPYTGDTVSISGTATGTYNSKDVATATTVTFGGLSLTGAQGSDYLLTTQGAASATITAKALTESGLSVPASKVYDATTTATVSGTPILPAAEAPGTGSTADGAPYSGDIVSITGTPTGTYNIQNVATATTVTFGGLSLTGAQAGDYTLTIQSPASATITARPVSLTGSRTYDGTSTATASILTLANNLDDGNLTLSGTATLASKNAGTENITLFTGLTLGGSAAGNYTLIGASGSVTINALVVSLTGSRVYDGTATAAASVLSVANNLDDGSLTLSGSVNLADKDVPSQSITSFAGLTLGGSAVGNYTLTGANGSVTINPLPVVLTGTRTYDGTANAVFTILTIANKVAGDVVNLSAGSAALAGKDVGTQAVLSYSGGTTAGNDKADYTVTGASGSVIITPATLTVTANPKTKVYGQADPALTYNATGFQVGDTAASVLTGALSRTPGEHVAGSPYAITQGTLAANADYTISFTGSTLTITPATLTVKTDPQTKVYGAADPTLTYVATGFQFSDTGATVLSGALTRAAGETVAGSPYAISKGTLSANSDYTIAFTGNNLTITPATLTITANHQSKVYGQPDPTLTYGVSGLQFSDTATGVLTGALARAAGEHVAGSPYAISQGTLAANGNYTISFTGNTLTITPATLTVTADAQTKVYGAADPTLTYQVSGFQFSDSGATVLTGGLTRPAGEHVAGSPYAIGQGTLAADSDYTIAFTGNSLTITPATLTVKADPQTKVYGAADPTLTYQASGFKFSDSGATVLTGGLTRAAGEHVAGSPYAISQGTLAADSDYTIAFTGSSLTITPATLTVTADAQTKVYGAADPTLTYQASGFQFSDTGATVLSGALTRAAGETVAGSPYAISQGNLAASSDYTISFTGSSLTITPATLTVKADSQTKVYGAADPTLTYVATGFQFSDTAATVLTGSLSRTAGEHVAGSPYAIGQGNLAANSDYTISFTGSSLTITPATLSVKADPQTKVYGAADPTLTYVATGFQFSDTGATVLSGALTRAAGETVAGSPYAISQGALSANSDYIIAFTGSSLTITPATLTVTADPQTKVYGETDPALTYQASGFKFSDTAGSVLTGSLTRAAGEHVAGSPYAIGQGTLAANSNYTISFTGNSLTITPATLTVTADPKTKVYGTPDPSLTYQVSGLQFGESAGSVLTGGLTRVAGETVSGSPYAILIGSLAADTDYTISFTGNSLKITKADTKSVVTCPAVVIVFGSNITFTATVTDASYGSSGTPTGTVTFKDGNIALFTATLAGGTATFSSSSLQVGGHSITVVYSGDGNFNSSTSSVFSENVIASVNVTFLPPLAGQPVGNKIKVGQVVPHKVDLVNSLGQSVTAGVTVKLKVQGVDTSNNTITVFQDVVEDANGVGSDGTVTSDGIMAYTSGHWQFNLDTSNFSDPNTYSENARYYTSTVCVVDNATMLVLGSTTINLETGK